MKKKGKGKNKQKGKMSALVKVMLAINIIVVAMYILSAFCGHINPNTKGTDFTALGCAFQKLSEKTKARLGVSYGVQVVGVEDGKFREAGISDGFIILEVNKKPVNSQEDVENIYNSVMNDANADKVLVIKGLEQTGRPRYKIVPLIEEE